MENKRICLYEIIKTRCYKSVYDDAGNEVRIDVGPYRIKKSYYDSINKAVEEIKKQPQKPIYINALTALELCNEFNINLLKNIDDNIKEHNE